MHLGAGASHHRLDPGQGRDQVAKTAAGGGGMGAGGAIYAAGTSNVTVSNTDGSREQGGSWGRDDLFARSFGCLHAVDRSGAGLDARDELSAEFRRIVHRVEAADE